MALAGLRGPWQNYYHPPPANGPPFGNEESWPPKDFLLKNPMFWLILELQSVGSWTHKIILVMKGAFIMDGSACGLCLKNIAYCMLLMRELPGLEDFQTPES